MDRVKADVAGVAAGVATPRPATAGAQANGPETRALAALAWPVVLAEIGWMGMGLVDTAMVGRISPSAIGAVAVGSHLSFNVAIFGIGILFGLDPIVSQAVGAGRSGLAHRALVNGLGLATLLSFVLVPVLWGLATQLKHFGVDPRVLPDARAYLEIITWSVPLLLGYTAVRRYLQGLGLVRPIFWAILVANVFNVFANWVLIFGHLGLPALGVAGSAWATTSARLLMCAWLGVVAARHAHRDHAGRAELTPKLDLSLLAGLLRIGLPAGVHIAVEGGIFTVVTLVAASLDPVSLAAHQIALSIAAFTFMVPLGLSTAAAVRVGYAVGGRDRARAAAAGRAALGLGALFMGSAAIVFLLAPRAIVALFTDDPAVTALGVSLLAVAAVFQLFDGTQVVSSGILRGTGETRLPMLIALAGFWGLGLPVGLLFCFSLGLGVIGLWIGITAGLVSVATALLLVWHRRVPGLPDGALPVGQSRHC